MAGKHTGIITIIVGLILILDSFVVIQNMFIGTTGAVVTNGFELILGIVVLGIGIKIRQMKE